MQFHSKPLLDTSLDRHRLHLAQRSYKRNTQESCFRLRPFPFEELEFALNMPRSRDVDPLLHLRSKVKVWEATHRTTCRFEAAGKETTHHYDGCDQQTRTDARKLERRMRRDGRRRDAERKEDAQDAKDRCWDGSETSVPTECLPCARLPAARRTDPCLLWNARNAPFNGTLPQIRATRGFRIDVVLVVQDGMDPCVPPSNVSDRTTASDRRWIFVIREQEERTFPRGRTRAKILRVRFKVASNDRTEGFPAIGRGSFLRRWT